MRQATEREVVPKPLDSWMPFLTLLGGLLLWAGIIYGVHVWFSVAIWKVAIAVSLLYLILILLAIISFFKWISECGEEEDRDPA